MTILSWTQALKIALGEERPTVTASVAYTVRRAFADYWDYWIAKSPARSVVVDQIRAEKVITNRLRPKTGTPNTSADACACAN